MSGKTHNVKLELIGKAAFEANAGSSGSLIVDGSPEIGGENRGMRPMELLLSALASCSAMDVLHILRKQGQTIESLTIDVQGTRADAVPAPYTEIHLVFEAKGEIAENKLHRAVALGVEKYCSVGATFDKGVKITWETKLLPND